MQPKCDRRHLLKVWFGVCCRRLLALLLLYVWDGVGLMHVVGHDMIDLRKCSFVDAGWVGLEVYYILRTLSFY